MVWYSRNLASKIHKTIVKCDENLQDSTKMVLRKEHK